MEKIRVCVFPAQNESSVEINNALSVCENIEVFGVTSIEGHNAFNFVNYNCNMPKIDDPSFLKEFSSFLKEEKIDIVFPTNDSAIEFFAKNKDVIPARVTNDDYQTAVICNSKKKTYDLFSDCDFCPNVYEEKNIYPCFVKPIDGEGAVGATRVDTVDDLPKDIVINEYVFMELLDGIEMTVDCLTDANGKLIVVLPRNRQKVFAGMSVVGTTAVATEEILNIANIINDRLILRGMWYFQIKQNSDGKFKLLEISMRCAGTMCQTRARGYNLPLLTVYTALEQDVNVIDNNFKVTIDRTLFARYATDLHYDTVYVDYDGTIIVKNKICLSMIRFLYQCKNAGIRIVLITRHNEDHNNDIIDDLNSFGISTFLFDEIKCLDFNTAKYTVIDNTNSIFIDNSYFERLEVHNTIGIPVFSVDGIDVLQDWRL